MIEYVAKITIIDYPEKIISSDNNNNVNALQAAVYNNAGDAISDVPVILRYVLPNNVVSSFSAVTDNSGIVLFPIPSCDREGTGYFQVISEACASQQVAITYQKGAGGGKGLYASIATPGNINKDVDFEIPVMVMVSSTDKTIVPKKVTLVLTNTFFTFNSTNKSMIILDLKDGVASTSITMKDTIPVERITVMAYQPLDNKPDGILIGAKEIPIRREETVSYHVEANSAQEIRDPGKIDKLYFHVLDINGRDIQNVPAYIQYIKPVNGVNKTIITPAVYDKTGAFIPIPQQPEDVKNWQCSFLLLDKIIQNLFFKYEKGQLQGWGYNMNEEGVEFVEQFIKTDNKP